MSLQSMVFNSEPFYNEPGFVTLSKWKLLGDQEAQVAPLGLLREPVLHFLWVHIWPVYGPYMVRIYVALCERNPPPPKCHLPYL